MAEAVEELVLKADPVEVRSCGQARPRGGNQSERYGFGKRTVTCGELSGIIAYPADGLAGVIRLQIFLIASKA